MRKGQIVKCELCPKYCRIAVGQSGECRIRVNIDGVLRAVTFGFPCAVHVDPMEKKPLFHFYPGEETLSLATVGCNLHCKNCQNWEISQANPEETPAYNLPPEKIVKIAIEENIPHISYTYTEPLIFYEYTYQTSVLSREKGITNTLVTAGFLNEEPLRELFKYTDAANIDLKAFSNRFYEDICSANLKPVLNCLVLAKQMGVWVEVTNLIIPTLNDDMEMIRKMCKWHLENLTADTPLHFSKFYPRYKLKNLPPTPQSTLEKAREIALETGLKYVYVGNVWGTESENTYCPTDKKLLIKRVGYQILEYHIKNAKCEYCGTKIAGVFR